MNNIEKIQEYVPTVYVNDSEPDLDETNLNKTEQAIKRVTDAANKAIDALKQLDQEKLALSAISNVLSNATDKVPSLALVNTMQRAIDDINSNLANKVNIGDIPCVSKTGILTANTSFTFDTDQFPWGSMFLFFATGNSVCLFIRYSNTIETFTIAADNYLSVTTNNLTITFSVTAAKHYSIMRVK